MAKASKSTVGKLSILEKILKNENHSIGEILKSSSYFQNMEMAKTSIPMLNVALSGYLEGGISDGMTVVAGPSRHFKSMFGLVMVKAFLDKYADGAVVFYDSEKGITKKYFESLDIDETRIVHVPVLTVEELRNKMASMLSDCERGDHIMFFVDSVGNLPSNKELNDAEDQKEVSDMTRAKAVKSFTRVVSGQLKFKNIPAIVIAHTYKTMEMFSKDVVGGGTGMIYVPDTVWIIGRRRDKGDDGETDGFEFVIRVEKSRFLKEGTVIPIRVSFEHGIHRFSGLSDLAVEAKILTETRGKKNKKAFTYTNKKGEVIEILDDDIDQSESFWDNLLKDSNLGEWINTRYHLTGHTKFSEVEETIN